jgi:hypothetical protein
LDLGWFIDWEKDCYCLGHIREKGKGHKIIGYYSKHNLPNCFWHYINNMVYKSDLNGKNQIVNGFSKYYKVVENAIDEHDNWDVLEKPEAAKPTMPKVRKSGGGQMKLAYNFKRKN